MVSASARTETAGTSSPRRAEVELHDAVSQVADEVEIERRQDPFDHHLACPRCWAEEREDRAMKEDHGGGLVCSLRRCRYRLSVNERDKAIPSHVDTRPGLCCGKCRSATKDHGKGCRICSNKNCRQVFQLGGFQ